MEEQIVNVTIKQIGDTLYIVESAISSSARETAYDKVKRLILSNAAAEIKKPA